MRAFKILQSVSLGKLPKDPPFKYKTKQKTLNIVSNLDKSKIQDVERNKSFIPKKIVCHMFHLHEVYGKEKLDIFSSRCFSRMKKSFSVIRIYYILILNGCYIYSHM